MGDKEKVHRTILPIPERAHVGTAESGDVVRGIGVSAGLVEGQARHQRANVPAR